MKGEGVSEEYERDEQGQPEPSEQPTRVVDDAPPASPGALVPHGNSSVIETARGAVLPLVVQAENRREQAWEEYLRGARLDAGTLFRTA